MKNLFSILTMTFIVIVAQGQTTGQLASYTVNADRGITDALHRHAIGSIADGITKSTYTDDSIEGSPYLSNAFSKTTVFLGNEDIGKLYYRYNTFNEEIEIKQQNIAEEPVRALDKNKKINILVDGKPMGFKTFIDKSGKTKNGYLTLLRDGKFKLYKRVNTSFKEAKKAPNSFTKDTPARFTQFTEYYVELEGGKTINYIDLKNKKVLEMVDGKRQSELQSFLKNQRIKIKNEQDITKVIDFLNG